MNDNIAINRETTGWPEEWLTLANGHGLRKGRYVDPAFARLEFERLWSRVWQFAARLDEVQKVGDHTVYEIGEQSVMIVRVDTETVKAYHNFCPHRGTALADGGCGHFEKNQIMCPFHGWTWDLEGNNTRIFEQQEFRDGQLQNRDVPLKPVHAEVFAGFVFVNFAKDPQPFDEFIQPVREMLENLAVGDMHHYWWKSVTVPSNWKIAQEAFFEAFHVPTTHPQLDDAGREFIYEGIPHDIFGHSHVKYDGLANGHGRFYASEKAITSNDENAGEEALEHMIDHMQHLVDEMDTMVLQRDVEVAKTLRGKSIPDGSSYGAEFIKAIYADAAMKKRPMPKLTAETATMWGGEIFIFPNLLILPNLGNVMFYRSRPNGDDPNSCTFEIFATTTYPAEEPVPRAKVQKMTDVSDPDQFLLIPRQDMCNIPRIQKGLRTSGCRQVWLAHHSEKIIINMHQELDRYLQEPL